MEPTSFHVILKYRERDEFLNERIKSQKLYVYESNRKVLYP